MFLNAYRHVQGKLALPGLKLGGRQWSRRVPVPSQGQQLQLVNVESRSSSSPSSTSDSNTISGQSESMDNQMLRLRAENQQLLRRVKQLEARLVPAVGACTRHVLLAS